MAKNQNTNLAPILTHALAFAAGRWSKKEPTPADLLDKHGLKYLSRIVKEWRPVNCSNERDCQLALQNYLLGRFSEDRLRVDREYGLAHSKVDIVVENDYGIEMKFSSLDESEIKRLETQVKLMLEHLEGVLVVLCGEVTEDTFVRLENEFKEEDEEEERLICDVVQVAIINTRQ